jgi:hypothetical protein
MASHVVPLVDEGEIRLPSSMGIAEEIPGVWDRNRMLGDLKNGDCPLISVWSDGFSGAVLQNPESLQIRDNFSGK